MDEVTLFQFYHTFDNRIKVVFARSFLLKIKFSFVNNKALGDIHFVLHKDDPLPLICVWCVCVFAYLWAYVCWWACTLGVCSCGGSSDVENHPPSLFHLIYWVSESNPEQGNMAKSLSQSALGIPCPDFLAWNYRAGTTPTQHLRILWGSELYFSCLYSEH